MHCYLRRMNLQVKGCKVAMAAAVINVASALAQADVGLCGGKVWSPGGDAGMHYSYAA